MDSIASVSYLNARPLIHGLEDRRDLSLVRALPSQLLEHLLQGWADCALCPVIDYQKSPIPLMILPVGAIGSLDRTLTVRVFSRCEIEDIKKVFVDGDSHTSVALLRIILNESFGIQPEISPLREEEAKALPPDIETALLIGDKVITAEPKKEIFPFQLDLGEAWRELTGLPFVFAVWMSPESAAPGEIPDILSRTREENLHSLDRLVPVWADDHGWPVEAAREYLENILEFSVGEKQLEAMELFWEKAAQMKLISAPDPLRIFTP